jgi:hypothetical protein
MHFVSRSNFSSFRVVVRRDTSVFRRANCVLYWLMCCSAATHVSYLFMPLALSLIECYLLKQRACTVDVINNN